MQLEIFTCLFISLASGCIPTYTPNFQEQEIFTTVVSNSASPATSTVATSSIAPTSTTTVVTTTSTVATTTTTPNCPCALPNQVARATVTVPCTRGVLDSAYPAVMVQDCVLTMSGCTNGFGFYTSMLGSGMIALCKTDPLFTTQFTCDTSNGAWEVPGGGTFTYVSCT